MKTGDTESILQLSVMTTRNAENASGSIFCPDEGHDVAMILTSAHHTTPCRRIVLITWIKYCRRNVLEHFSSGLIDKIQEAPQYLLFQKIS